jgi:hypothetical protein
MDSIPLFFGQKDGDLGFSLLWGTVTLRGLALFGASVGASNFHPRQSTPPSCALITCLIACLIDARDSKLTRIRVFQDSFYRTGAVVWINVSKYYSRLAPPMLVCPAPHDNICRNLPEITQ